MTAAVETCRATLVSQHCQGDIDRDGPGRGRDREVFEQRTQRSMEAMSRKDLAAVMRWWADDAVLETCSTTATSRRISGSQVINW
jgi:hypothetical protein